MVIAKPTTGILYISLGMENLEFLNDSTLSISLEKNLAKINYYIKSDTLFVKYGYRKVLHDYPIISLSRDTLKLKNTFRDKFKPSNWEDTLVFVNLERLREPIQHFKYFNLHSNFSTGSSFKLNIDSLGNISFTRYPVFVVNGREQGRTGIFTDAEFARFKDLLSKSLLKKLSSAGNCGLDGQRDIFTYADGESVFSKRTCLMPLPLTIFYRYLFKIETNKGVKWQK